MPRTVNDYFKPITLRMVMGIPNDVSYSDFIEVKRAVGRANIDIITAMLRFDDEIKSSIKKLEGE